MVGCPVASLKEILVQDFLALSAVALSVPIKLSLKFVLTFFCMLWDDEA